MTSWIIWGFLLVLQNAAHTATSRARNSSSLWYSGIASVFGNGVWFASQFFIVGHLLKAQGDPKRLAFTAFFYVTLTAFGTVGAQWLLMNHVERGSMKVKS
jgi:hypothetical protein